MPKKVAQPTLELYQQKYEEMKLQQEALGTSITNSNGTNGKEKRVKPVVADGVRKLKKAPIFCIEDVHQHLQGVNMILDSIQKHRELNVVDDLEQRLCILLDIILKNKELGQEYLDRVELK